MIANQPATAPFQSASLYVGDLHNEITESELFELFNKVGPVASIRVCRDTVTRRSLGYAYVNFHDVQDAERALDTMNFTDIKDKGPCRIMWSQRDPSLRKSGVGNVFVRNLAPSVDNKGLYDTFSVFGNILSCKVANDEQGNSKRYGYVHFETAEAAQDAIDKFNGTLIDDVEVTVSSFVRRQDRADKNEWTNLYVKQFPTAWDDEKVKALFTPYGEIASFSVSKDEEGKSKGFGFVNFTEHESAKKALDELANKSLEDGEGGNFELYVSTAQKKSERAREIKKKMDQLQNERVSKYQGMNLYVKNIADTVTDEQFREAFAPFGTITSARIMREGGEGNISKGFGFVCYSSPEEATRAVKELNGKALDGKPLLVTLHQRKEHRRQHLAAYPPNTAGRFPQGMGPQGMPMHPFMGMYMPGQPGFPGGPGGPRGMPYPYPGPGPMAGGRGGGGRGGMPYGAPRPGFPYPGMPVFMNGNGPQMGGMPGGMPGGMNQGGRGGGRGGPQNPQGGYPMQGGGPGRGNMPRGMPGQMQGGRGGGPGMMGGPRGVAGYPNQQMGGPGMMGPGGPQGGPQGQQQVRGGQIKFSNQARNQQGPGGGMMPPQQQMMMMQGQQIPPQQQAMPQMPSGPADSLSNFHSALAQADPQAQKNMIGEQLYPLIFNHQPELAGKITGMLLEMDNGELLNLIESPDALTAKIDEALNVLRMHKPAEE